MVYYVVKLVILSLLKVYICMGVFICGEVCFDLEFNVVDLFVLLDIKNVLDCYVKYFLCIEEVV